MNIPGAGLFNLVLTENKTLKAKLWICYTPFTNYSANCEFTPTLNQELFYEAQLLIKETVWWNNIIAKNCFIVTEHIQPVKDVTL